MLSLYFTPEAKLPAGAGFPLFGAGHISALICAAAFTILALMLFRHLPEAGQNRMMKISASLMLVMELTKDFILALLGAFSVGYLPLHLCSLAMFVCLYFAFHPASRSCGQILYSVCLPGAVCALVFPNWTGFPLLHFQSLHSFVYHFLLAAFSLMPVVSGRCRPGLGGVLPSMVFLAAACVVIAPINHCLGTNYLFLSRPSVGSPLELLTHLPGKYGYLLGYGILVLLVLLLMNLPFTLIARRRKRRHGNM